MPQIPDGHRVPRQLRRWRFKMRQKPETGCLVLVPEPLTLHRFQLAGHMSLRQPSEEPDRNDGRQEEEQQQSPCDPGGEKTRGRHS
jgi:hypothetical protein